MPVVSVIIPAFNVDAYIKKAVLSALTQDLEDLEVIVVNDASTDNTESVVKEIQDARLKLISNRVNQGAAVSRNIALETASGTWIALLDSDDWYSRQDRLTTLLSEVTRYSSESVIVADDVTYLTNHSFEHRGTLRDLRKEHDGRILSFNAASYISDAWGKRWLHIADVKPLFKREFINRYNISYQSDLRLGNDYFFLLDCLLNGAQLKVLPYCGYIRRLRDNSLTTQDTLGRLACYRQGASSRMKFASDLNESSIQKALSENISFLDRKISYFHTVKAIKAQDYGSVVQNIIQEPLVLVELIREFPRVIWQRIASI